MKKTMLIIGFTLLVSLIGIAVLAVALDPQGQASKPATATAEKPETKKEEITFVDKELPTKKEYEQVKQGMTIAQVDQVLGKPTDSSETEMENLKMTTNTYSAKGDLGASIIISFDNGKVTSKSQFGLK